MAQEPRITLNSEADSTARPTRRQGLRRWFCNHGPDIVLLALALAYYAVYLKSFPLFQTGDEGYLYYVAFALARGQIPYRDIVLYSYLPGYFYPFTLIFEQWGPSVMYARILMLIGLSAIPWMFYRAARLVADQWIALGVALVILLVPGPWERFHIGLLGVGLIWSCLALLKSPSRARWTALGAVIGLAFLVRMDIAVSGVALLLILCAVQLWVTGCDRKDLVWALFLALLTATAVTLPMLIWFGTHGILQEHAWQWLRFLGLAWERSASAARMEPPRLAALASLSVQGVEAWLFYGSFVPVVLLCLKAVRDGLQRPLTVLERERLASIIVIIAWSLVNLPQYAVERPDVGHFTRQAFAFLLPLAAVLTDAGTRFRNGSSGFSKASAIAVLAAFSLYSITFVGKYTLLGPGGSILLGHSGSIAWWWAPAQWYSLSNGISYPMRLIPDMNRFLDHVIRKTEPDEPLATLPFLPAVNFLTQRLCPNRHAFLVPHAMRAGVEEEYIGDIRRGRIPFIVIAPAEEYTAGKPTMLKDFAPRLEAEIENSYKISAMIRPRLFFLVHRSRLP